MVSHSSFALLATTEESAKESERNCAAAGIQFFQMFSSTSALLGLSRSSDYSAVNANLNALIDFRRTFALCGQSNMWGQIAGTGLAGSGTGAAGRHGDTSKGAAAHELVFNNMPKEPAKPQPQEPEGEFPPEYYKREPATDDIVVVHRESVQPFELQHQTTLEGLQAEGFLPVRGLQVSVRTREKQDKVLLLCNLPTSTQCNHEGVRWALKRGSESVGPLFSTWTGELGRLDNVLMPWLDEPGKARLECDYSVSYRTRDSVQLSKGGEKRHLSAVLLPGDQVTVANSREALAVQPGRWYNVPGLQQIAVTSRNEKVLVVCTIKYTALWSDEMTRGRFTIFRDGKSLDPESYGLQSVRALQKGVKRTLVMTLVDDPPEGPHIYEARAAVTTSQGEVRVCHLDDEPRQLALIRLPESMVVGPYRCLGMTRAHEDRWTEIDGLSAEVSVEHAHDRVLLVWHANFNPTGMQYEAYFTLFRSTSYGPMKNLGSEDQGVWSVASSATGSSEYPSCMFVDTPGPGTFTYTVHVRTRRCGSLMEATPVEVGPDGQIAAVMLASKRSTTSANVVELMTAEIDAARAKAQKVLKERENA